MATLQLGVTPLPLTVTLSHDADFACGIYRMDNSVWPAGSTVTLVLGTVSWPATLSGVNATWAVDKAQVAALIDSGARSVALVYTQGDLDVVWARGSVQIA